MSTSLTLTIFVVYGVLGTLAADPKRIVRKEQTSGDVPEEIKPGDVVEDFHHDKAKCLGAWKDSKVTTSRLATQEELEEPDAKTLVANMKIGLVLHRKVWEMLYVLKVMNAINLLSDGKQAIGFAVGTEPTVSYMASKHVAVTATDLPPGDGAEKEWKATNQHMAAGLESMNKMKLATSEDMQKYVKQVYVNMNTIEQTALWKQQLGTFDFAWSICSVEHVGSIRKALDFMVKSLQLLKPGGTVVHTTEFNLVSLNETLDHGGTVFFREKDIDALQQCAVQLGYEMDKPCYDMGKGPIDYQKDLPPYSHDVHMRLAADKYITTCIGMTITKPLTFKDNGLNCDTIFTSVVGAAE